MEAFLVKRLRFYAGMASRRPKSSPKPRTITTRSQTKKSQENMHQKTQIEVGFRATDKTVKMKANKKKRSLKRKRKLLHLAVQQQAAKPGAGAQNKEEIGFGANGNSEKTVLLQNQTESLRQEFHEERRVSLFESPGGKSIQITCGNYSNVLNKENDISTKNDNGSLVSYSEVSTVFDKQSNDHNDPPANCNELLSNHNDTSVSHNTPSTSNWRNMSLASFDKEHIKRKQAFKIQNHINTEKNQEDDDVICLDDTVPFISDICNDISSSVILIDDLEEQNCTTTRTEQMEIIDLTTPVLPRKRTTADPTEATSSNTISMRDPILTADKSNDDSSQPHRSNAPFPPIHQLHFPPSQADDPFPLCYNLQSNIYGSNFLHVGTIRATGLRQVFIDGNNVAMQHSNGRYFSVKGIQICIDYFKLRGHEVFAIVPQIRKRRHQCSDQKMLFALEKQGTVIFTPSRVINGRNIIPYDDRFIVQLAAVNQGVVVSCDNYRDLWAENPNLRDTIDNRVLNPTFVKDMLIFPSDPLGRYGPGLDEFLRFP